MPSEVYASDICGLRSRALAVLLSASGITSLGLAISKTAWKLYASAKPA